MADANPIAPPVACSIPPHAKFTNLIGRKFGRLAVRYFAGRKGHSAAWACECDCGAFTVVCSDKLKCGHTQSCGCLAIERATYRVFRHGHSQTALYNVWNTMLSRCYNVKAASYGRYGGRGIRVCERWRNSFEAFRDDMGLKPTYAHTLDRKNNEADYCDENCHWATQTEQANNRRSNAIFEYAGKRLTIAQWSRETGIAYDTIKQRIRKLKWSIHDALTVSPRCKR